MSNIVAIGGAGFEPDTPDTVLYQYLVDLTGKSRPKAAFLPQAGGENVSAVLAFKRTFSRLGCEASSLSLVYPHTADLRGYLLEQDLIFVGGGNTKVMLAMWREWGLDRLLKEAWESGIVLGGVSAGAICWFEQGNTDSIPGRLSALPCLGYLPGSCCPHYDSEPNRRPDYLQKVAAGEMIPGIALQENVGVHFVGTEVHSAISSRAEGQAFRVFREGERSVEEPLDVRYLGRV